MNLKEKIKYLQDEHFSEWLRTRKKVDEEISNSQSVFCICGKLATGFHESVCKKFNDKVTNNTIKRLEHLIIKDK